MNSPAVLITTAKVRSGEDKAFFAWQQEHSKVVSAFPGFVSSDLIPPADSVSAEWTLIMNFRSAEDLAAWQSSDQRAKVIEEAKPFLEGGSLGERVPQGGIGENPGANVTEAIFSRIKPGMDDAYREWTVRIQAAQAKFAGYRGTYLQPPTSSKNRHWTTLLRYDSARELEAWMASSERAQLLEESKVFIENEELMRLATSFPGWVPINLKDGEAAPDWKIALLVLLGLFPVVMLEIIFLGALLAKLGLNSTGETFIGNALSVALTSFITVPLCIHWFGWWLFPKKGQSAAVTVKGAAVIAGLFALEIAFFSWMLR